MNTILKDHNDGGTGLVVEFVWIEERTDHALYYTNDSHV